MSILVLIHDLNLIEEYIIALSIQNFRGSENSTELPESSTPCVIGYLPYNFLYVRKFQIFLLTETSR